MTEPQPPTELTRNLRDSIAAILVKNGLRTDQVAIGELAELLQDSQPSLRASGHCYEVESGEKPDTCNTAVENHAFDTSDYVTLPTNPIWKKGSAMTDNPQPQTELTREQLISWLKDILRFYDCDERCHKNYTATIAELSKTTRQDSKPPEKLMAAEEWSNRLLLGINNDSRVPPETEMSRQMSWGSWVNWVREIQRNAVASVGGK